MRLKEQGKLLKDMTGVIVLLLASIALGVVLNVTGWQVSGCDLWGHVFKAKYLYQHIKEGDLYPIYFSVWYNGSQPYRHWAPVSYLVLAIQMFITGGRVRQAYLLFISVLYFIGGLPWVIWGNIQKMRIRGTFFAVTWFFLPGILKIFMAEGNMPQMLSTTITPYLLLFTWLYVRREKKNAALGIYISMMLMAFSHLMITAITGISFFIYLLVDAITQKTWKRGFVALCYMVMGIVSAGIWMIPAVLSGMMSNGGGVGEGTIYYYPLSVSLNPLYRVFNDRNYYYFGLFIIIVCIFGIIASRERKISGFVFPIVILVLTSPAIFKVISIIPLAKLLWASRFAPVMYALFYAAVMEWKTIKKKYAALTYALILADILPSFFLGAYYEPATDQAMRDSYILRDMTEHRASVMDLSAYGSYPSYGLCVDDGVDYTFGWAYQGADIASNVMMLNESLEYGKFLYMFDRSVELGDDTVLVQRDRVTEKGNTFEAVIAAANVLGYRLEYQNETAMFFKRDLPEEFGVVTDYYGIAIGEYSSEMTLMYPSFEEGTSDYIDEYQYEDLCGYNTIFLSGFRYHDRSNAEDLIRRLGENGTRVVIDSTHMPADGITKNEEFMGVLNQKIVFENHYPTLNLYGDAYVLGRFGEGDELFTTGYISTIENEYGYFEIEGERYAFCGTNNDSPNVYFVALNLLYFATSTDDASVVNVLDTLLMSTTEALPVRRVVPITIEIDRDKITVTSEYDNVNTTLAYLDIFESDDTIINSNNLLVVNSGTTVINMHYPHFKLALVTSILGVLMFVLTFVFENKVYRLLKKDK